MEKNLKKRIFSVVLCIIMVLLSVVELKKNVSAETYNGNIVSSLEMEKQITASQTLKKIMKQWEMAKKYPDYFNVCYFYGNQQENAVIVLTDVSEETKKQFIEDTGVEILEYGDFRETQYSRNELMNVYMELKTEFQSEINNNRIDIYLKDNPVCYDYNNMSEERMENYLQDSQKQWGEKVHVSVKDYEAYRDMDQRLEKEYQDKVVVSEWIDFPIENVPVDSKSAKIASLHNPISNDAEQTVTYSAVYFGSYPQSEVTGEALTQEIVDAEYVSGDAVVLDKKYRRLQDENGTFRYFLYEPIKWRVICKNGNEAVLRSDLILDSQAYSDYVADIWFDCTLRDWLNSYTEGERGFLTQAFSSEEIAAINDKMFDTHEDYYEYAYIHGYEYHYNDIDFCAVRDKVYLLSGAEMYGLGGVKEPYELKTQGSDYAFVCGLRSEKVSGETVTGEATDNIVSDEMVTDETLSDSYADWWVRDNRDFYKGFRAGYVDEAGIRYEVSGDAECVDPEKQKLKAISQDTKGLGVCPAIVLNLEKTQLWYTQEELESGVNSNQDVQLNGVKNGQCGDNVYYRIEDDGTAYITGNGEMYDYTETNISPFHKKSHIRKVIIEEGVESIGQQAFCYMENLEQVIIADSVETIGNGAFFFCENLEKTVIPKGVNSIGKYALIGTKWMKQCQNKNPMVIVNGILLDMSCCEGEVEIPADVHTIGGCAIPNLEDIDKLVIPSTVQNMDIEALGGIIGNDSYYNIKEESSKIYVMDESVAEQYLTDNGWEGYHVEKKPPVQSTLPSEPKEPEESELPDVPEGPIQSKPPVSEVTVQTVILGDVNQDKQITLADAQLILRLALLLEEHTDYTSVVANVDEDEAITLADAQVILKAALLLIPWDKTIEINTTGSSEVTQEAVGIENDEEAERDEEAKTEDTKLQEPHIPCYAPEVWEPFLIKYEDPIFVLKEPSSFPVPC